MEVFVFWYLCMHKRCMSRPYIFIPFLFDENVGAMGVANNFYGTNVILNGDLPEVEAYKTK